MQVMLKTVSMDYITESFLYNLIAINTNNYWRFYSCIYAKIMPINHILLNVIVIRYLYDCKDPN